jgi:hypothetical protein
MIKDVIINDKEGLHGTETPARAARTVH